MIGKYALSLSLLLVSLPALAKAKHVPLDSPQYQAYVTCVSDSIASSTRGVDRANITFDMINTAVEACNSEGAAILARYGKAATIEMVSIILGAEYRIFGLLKW